MSEGMVLKGSNGTWYSFTHIATQKWLDGQWSGAKMVEAWLRGEAAARFTAGADADAVRLRLLADYVCDTIMCEIKERAEAYAVSHPMHVAPPKKRRRKKT